MNWTNKDSQDLGLMILGVVFGVTLPALVPSLAPNTILGYGFVIIVGLAVGYALRFGVRHFLNSKRNLFEHTIIHGRTRDGMGKPESKRENENE